MRNRLSLLNSIALLAAAAACSSSGGGGGGTDPSQQTTDPAEAPLPVVGVTAGNGSKPSSALQAVGQATLDARVVDYGEALRTASLKLVGELPPLADIVAMAQAQGDAARTLYASKVDAMLADPRFAVQMIRWWQNTFKTGDQGQGAQFDTAATFAAMVVVKDRPWSDILTASAGTCPTYENGQFTAADCQNGAPTAGILTDPGIMAQFFGNMAFRRARFVQETFACSKMPAEYGANPTPMGASIYTSPWPFQSITGGQGAKIDFQNTTSVICANCHTTLNHLAPLFAEFDDQGAYTPGTIQVKVPLTPPVTATLSDWLPQGQGFAWRLGQPVSDLPGLGKTMAADPDVQRCAVTRVWNWAFSRGDVVNDLATVPPSVTDPYLASFASSGMKLKSVIHDVFTSDDFVRF
jgi:hypothetical protein